MQYSPLKLKRILYIHNCLKPFDFIQPQFYNQFSTTFGKVTLYLTKYEKKTTMQD